MVCNHCKQVVPEGPFCIQCGHSSVAVTVAPPARQVKRRHPFFISILLIFGLVTVCVGIAIYDRSSNPLFPTPNSDQTTPQLAAKPATCPIDSIKEGMTLAQVKAHLSRWKVEHRGERQDVDVYHVNTGTCQAFIDFNDETRRVSGVQYGEATVKPSNEEESNVTPQNAPPGTSTVQASTPAWQPERPHFPNIADGKIVYSDEYIAYFISANMGSNGFDSRQLAYLANEAWQANLTASNGDSGAEANAMMRFTRDWDYIAKANHQRVIEASSDSYPSTVPSDRPPILISSVDADYTAEARTNKIQGVSVVALTVQADGVPTDVYTVKALGHGLDESAIAAVEKYRFKPAIKNGVPVAMPITVQVNFHIY